MQEMRRRAAALDGGKALRAEYERVRTENSETLDRETSLKKELADLELRVKGARDKLKEIDKKLFSGAIVNPKEVTAYEAEIANLKKRIDADETRELEIMEALPEASNAAKAVKLKLQKIAAAFEEKKKSDVEQGESLQTEYRVLAGQRPRIIEKIPAGLLAQYEAIRKKQDGIGMAEVLGESCGACGTNIPTKVLDALDRDNLMTCESCHRILFKPVPGA